MPDALSLSRSELPEEIATAIDELIHQVEYQTGRMSRCNYVSIQARRSALTAAILSRLGEAQTQIRTQAMEQLAADAGWELDWDRVRAERDAALARVETLEWHLRECVNQLEYEHGKFGGTGSGETVLSRARSALSKAPSQGEQ